MGVELGGVTDSDYDLNALYEILKGLKLLYLKEIACCVIMCTHECTDIHTRDKIDRIILTPITEQPHFWV